MSTIERVYKNIPIGSLRKVATGANASDGGMQCAVDSEWIRRRHARIRSQYREISIVAFWRNSDRSNLKRVRIIQAHFPIVGLQWRQHPRPLESCLFAISTSLQNVLRQYADNRQFTFHDREGVIDIDFQHDVHIGDVRSLYGALASARFKTRMAPALPSLCSRITAA